MSTTATAPKPAPPLIARRLQEWKREARKHESRARAHRLTAELAKTSRDHWQEQATTAQRRHALAQSELMSVRVELTRVRTELMRAQSEPQPIPAPVALEAATPETPGAPSCPVCHGRWAEAWTWKHTPDCPLPAAEALEAEGDRRTRPAHPAAPRFTRPPTVAEAALWVRTTGRAWPMNGKNPAPVTVHFISGRHRIRALAGHTNAAAARATALLTPTKGTTP